MNPLPQGNSLIAVASLGESTWIAAGGPGQLLRTTDNGRTWTRIEIPATVGVRDIAFADDRTGFALGVWGEVLRTDDGGQEWRLQSWIRASSFNGIETIDASHVFVAGGEGIYRSLDGGATFEPFAVAGTGAVADIRFRDPARGIAVGDRGLAMKTVDGGTTWDWCEQVIASDLKAVDWASDEVVIAVGDDGTMVKSADAAENWILTVSGTDLDLRHIRFSRTGWGIAVGEDVLSSFDAGSYWEPASLTLGPPWYYAADFNAGGTALLVGSFGVATISSDQGGSWTSLGSGSRATLRAVHFAGELVGTAVGRYGTVLRTEDGGRTWFEQDSGTGALLGDAWLTDEHSGVVVGDDQVLFTRDAGATWKPSQVELLEGEGLSRLCFVSTEEGFAGSWFGNLYRTHDGGMSWELLGVRGPTGPIRALVFTSESVGHLADDSGRILRTTDGGASWSASRILGGGNYVTAVAFFDELHGIAVCGSQRVLRTYDGGVSWSIELAEVESYLVELAAMPGSDTAYAADDTGRIYRSRDRGQTWELESRIAHSAFEDLAIAGDALVVVGSGGTILRKMF